MTRVDKLSRLPRDDDGMPRYLHPHGYVIVKARRDWSLRGMTRGAQHQLSPLEWWEVFDHAGRCPEDVGVRYQPWAYRQSRRRDDFGTLREAREWCDVNPREGWA